MKINWNLVYARKQIEAEAALKIWPRFTARDPYAFCYYILQHYCSTASKNLQSKVALPLYLTGMSCGCATTRADPTSIW